MHRTTKAGLRKRLKLPAKQAKIPWRTLALKLFPEHKECISSKDEEFAIYNLFFQLRAQFAEAISSGDSELAAKIIGFTGRCLEGELASDGEDLALAAGVSFFEHIFEDTPRKRWPAIFSCMPRVVYHLGRHYPERWMGPAAFAKLDADATKFYG